MILLVYIRVLKGVLFMKNIKSLLSLGIALLMVISLFNTSVVTAIAVDTNVVSSGAIGGTVGECTWQYVSAIGKLIISGNGSMGCIEDEYNQPWADYSENINCVQIDEGVTEISDYAFYELNISEVSIPNTVETIGNEAFYCTQLKKITIPDSVTVIKEKAFSSCHNLESVTIGSGVELIGKDAFNWDEFAPEDYEINYPYFDRVNITDLSKWCSIKFDNAGSNPLYSGNNIYIDNKNVTALKIPSGVKSISDYAFCGSSIKSVSLFDSVETIGESAFEGCSELKEVKIPKSLKQVNENAFLNASALNKVCYEGKQDEWYNIDFYNGNSNLLNAEIVYNYISNESESVPVHKYYYEHLYIAGDSNGDSGFLHGINWTPTAAANEMVTTDGVCYTITFNGVGAGTYNWKICADDSWTVQWGLGDGVDNGIAVYQGMNLKLNVTAYSDVTITVDFSNYNPETNNSVKYNVIIVPNQNATTEPTSKQTEPSTDNKLINGYYPVGSAELFGMYWQPNQKHRMNYYAGYYYVDITNVKSGDYECKVIYYDNGSYEWYPDGMGNGLNFYVDDNSTVRIILNPHSREPYVEIYNPGETVPTFKPPVEPTNPTEPSTKATDPLTTPVQPTTQAAESTEPVAITESGIYLNNKKYNCSVGDTIIYRVYLQSDSLISCGQFSLEYPSDIIEFEIENIPNLSNCVLNHRQKNILAFNFLTLNGPLDFTENKLLLEFRFKVIKSGAGTIRLNKEILSYVDSTGDILDIIDYSYFNESLIVNSVSTTVKLNKSSGIVYRKGQLQIKSTVTNGKGKTTYKSSNIKVAKVNSSGKVTGEKKGTAIITVTNNEVSAKFKVTVKNPKLNLTKKTITVGKSFNIKITGQVGTPKFSSSNKKVTTVTSSGKVKGIKKGTATIKVKTNGLTLKCKVTVQPNYQKYKGTWKKGKNKIVIKSVKGSKIKAYLFTQFIAYDRVAYANVSGAIKNNSVKLYFKNDGWFNKGYCILKFKKKSINAKTKITHRNPSANANLYINGTFKKK